MMREPKQILDGLGFAANTAMGLARGVRDEIKTLVDHKINQKMTSLNLVTRAEYEELRQMVATMRQQQEDATAKHAISDAGAAQEDSRETKQALDETENPS